MPVFNNVRVNFWLRRQRVCKRARSSNFGKCHIMFYVVATGVRSTDMAAGIHCSPEDWDSGKLPVEVQQRIKKIEETINQINARYEFLEIVATGPMLMKDFGNKIHKPVFLLKIAKEFAESFKGKVEKQTARHYMGKYDNLAHYVTHKLKNPALTPFEVNNRFVMDMEQYFRTEHVCRRAHGKRVGLGVLTLKQQVDFLKGVMVFAQRRDYIKENPTVAYKVDIRNWQTDKTYLTEEEVEAIQKHHFLGEEMRQTADIFLFLCETGLSYCDYKAMNSEWIQRLGNMDLPRDIRDKVNPDELWIIGSRKKTKVPISVPLSPLALQILNKYGGADKKPYIDLGNLNPAIRVLGEACGINKKLSSRVARKTFAHFWRNRSGLSSKAASRLMGHSTDSMINHYADVHVEAAIREVYAKTA